MNNQPRYFFFDNLVRLKEHYAELSDTQRRELKSIIAMNCPDPDAVSLYADIAGDDWAHIYPRTETAPRVSTNSAIDTFLETYGHSSAEEDALLERLIFNPTPEYAGMLEAEARDNAAAPDDLTSQRINSFMAAHPAPKTPAAAQPKPQNTPAAETTTPASQNKTAIATATASRSATATTSASQNATAMATASQDATATMPAAHNSAHNTPVPENSSLSESLAKIYIKQGRYQRAYEIISDLNLKNPEKSVYFADQLRFLKKLMMIQNARESATSSSQPQ